MIRRLGSAAGSLRARLPRARSRWVLPFSVPIPDRRQLAAMGLATLAFGLIVGVALGPGLGSNGIAGGLPQILQFPGMGSGTEQEPTELDASPSLAGPAGSSSFGGGGGGGGGGGSTPTSTEPTSVDTGTETSPSPSAPSEADPPAPLPEEPEPEPAEEEAGTELAGTVVQVNGAAKLYAVADENGAVLTVSAPRLPRIGASISASVESAEDGLFAELQRWKQEGTAKRVKLSGTVSFLDSERAVYVLSSTGASIPIAVPPVDGQPAQLPEIGAFLDVEADLEAPKGGGLTPIVPPTEGEACAAMAQPATDTVTGTSGTTGVPAVPGAPSVTGPAGPTGPDGASPPPPYALVQRKAEPLGEPGSSFQLTGLVVARCAEPRGLVVSADDVRALGLDLPLAVPAKLGLKGLPLGKPVLVSVERTEAGDYEATEVKPLRS